MSDNILTKKERCDALIEMTKIHRERLNSRRSYQWKINLALWSGLGLLAGSIATGRDQLNVISSPWIWGSGSVVLMFIFTAHLRFVWGIATRNKSDKDLAKEKLDLAEDQIQEIAKKQKKRFIKSSSCPFWDYSFFSEIIITACLIGLVVLAVVSRKPWLVSKSENTTTITTTTKPTTTTTITETTTRTTTRP